MGLSRSTYYDAPVSTPDDTAIVETIAAICDEFEHYGWRRVQAALRQQGMIVNHKKIKRLMRKHDLQPPRRRRYVATTDSDHDQPIFPNLAKDMIVNGPNQLWVSDITYVANNCVRDGYNPIAQLRAQRFVENPHAKVYNPCYAHQLSCEQRCPH